MKKNNGFTLIELLVVIAILALLVLMALPAILRMYRSASISTFENEVKNVYKAAQTQFISYSETLDANGRFTYENETNPLEMIENRNLKYCIVIDINGRIKNINVSNGKYSYSKSGSDLKIGNIDVENSNDIELESDNTENICRNAPIITFVNRKNAGRITVGDEVAIRSEHFYVVSSDATTTELLAKYNLLVGDVYECNGESCPSSGWTKTKTLTSSDTGYGLQSSTAKGDYRGGNDRTGVVAFSGKGYWDNGNCVSDGSGGTPCPGSSGLKSEYANTANTEGQTGRYSEPYPYVYRGSMSSIAPSYTYGSPWGYPQDNGYTIAYYVENYVNTLKELGAPEEIEGKLLTREQINSLSSPVRGTWSYWLGSAEAYHYVSAVVHGDTYTSLVFCHSYYFGVRPVIVVRTSEMPN